MVVRTDIAVWWNLSPRIILVEADSVEITIQDLYDTCRDLEDNVANMDNPFLISAGGKEALGGQVFVGITATLQNAQVAFEQRTTAVSDGSATSTTDDTILTDLGADFVADGVVRGSIVHNHTDGSSASVMIVDSPTSLRVSTLTGGLDDTFESGDLYDIFLTVQCNIAGGNLVALDSVGANLDPVFPTSYTQVIRTSSSSATLQELEAIQFGEYNYGVTVYPFSPYSGTEYPVGTARQPVNNFSDALLIAAEKGFIKL
jgi:hypothetical protein